MLFSKLPYKKKFFAFSTKDAKPFSSQPLPSTELQSVTLIIEETGVPIDTSKIGIPNSITNINPNIPPTNILVKFPFFKTALEPSSNSVSFSSSSLDVSGDNLSFLLHFFAFSTSLVLASFCALFDVAGSKLVFFSFIPFNASGVLPVLIPISVFPAFTSVLTGLLTVVCMFAVFAALFAVFAVCTAPLAVPFAVARVPLVVAPAVAVPAAVVVAAVPAAVVPAATAPVVAPPAATAPATMTGAAILITSLFSLNIK